MMEQGCGGYCVEGEPVLLQTLSLRGEVTCVSLAGAWLACGTQRALHVWRWQVQGDGEEGGWQAASTAARAHRYAVTAAVWGAGGVALASGGVDGAVRVWGRSLGTARRELAAPGAAAVRAVCWGGAADGGGRLVAGHDDGAVCVWWPGRGQLAAVLRAHEGSLHSLATPLRGALLLSGCTNGVIKLHDMEAVISAGTEGGNNVPTLAWEDGAHDLGALCADTRRDGLAAATGGHDARVRVWRVSRAGLHAVYTLEGHAGAVTCVRWAKRGCNLLASSSLDGTARLWEVGEGACLRVLRANSRYLTAVALDVEARVLLTASNDKSIRMWSLGALTLHNHLAPHANCQTLLHFALGDLEGISSVESAPLPEVAVGGEGEGDPRCVRSQQIGAGSVNCVAAQANYVATACSDGSVHLFMCEEAEDEGEEEDWMEARFYLKRVLRGVEGGTGARGGYPALTVDFGAGGQILLSAGLDGQAILWDVESGCVLRFLSSEAGEWQNGGGGGGGGGVRDARISPSRPPLMLLATDDGVALLWSLAQPDSRPLHVYGGHAAAALCCAWSRGAGGGLLAAVGGAGGELRLHSALPEPCLVHQERDAHDLGVQDCDFAPTVSAMDLDDDDGYHLLVTAGSDCYIKFWLIQYCQGSGSSVATVRLARAVWAHGGGAVCVRVSQCGALVISGGEDRWARVWGVRSGRCLAALSATSPVSSVSFLSRGVVALGSLGGTVSVWRLGERVTERIAEGSASSTSGLSGDRGGEEEEGELGVRSWGATGVARWLREYVTRAPEFVVSPEAEAELLRRALLAGVTGARLLDDTLDSLLDALLDFDHKSEVVDDVKNTVDTAERDRLSARLREELAWLRRPLPPTDLASVAPHALLCPLTHALMWEPARAADGFSYDRANIHEWFLAEGSAVSPVSGRRLHSARVTPNYRLRAQLRAFLQEHQD